MRSSSDRGGPASSAGALLVVHEDNHLIVVWKPPGMPTQGDLTGDVSLLDVTKAWLKRKYDKPGNVYLGLVHRLDRPVGGLVVFAKTSKAAGRLSEQFREREVRKLYRAVVHGVPAPTVGELQHFLGEGGRDRFTSPPSSRRVAVRTSSAPGFKLARLRYATRESRGDLALLEIELETGRKHQIRAQLAAIGHAIVGDRKYGGPDLPPGHPLARSRGIALIAARLELAHPVRRDESMTFEIPAELDPLPELLRP